MHELRTFVARFGSHWVQLRQTFDGWTFLLWGKFPLSSKLGRLSERDAKEAAAVAAREHLRKHGLEISDMPDLSWRLAVRYTAA